MPSLPLLSLCTRGLGRSDQAPKRRIGECRGRWGMQETRGMVVGQQYAPHLKRELVAVEVAPEVSLIDRLLCSRDERIGKALLTRHQKIVCWAGLIVQLHGGCDKDASTRHARILLPAHPVLKPPLNPRLPARRLESVLHDLNAISLASCTQDLDLQLVLRSEMGKQAALGEPQIRRQTADAQTIEPVAASRAQCLVDNSFASCVSLGHA